MQRRANIPSSITFILRESCVLLVLAFDALRYYRITFLGGAPRRRLPRRPAE